MTWARLPARPSARERPIPELAQECRTGADANEREDCRIVGVVNSVQAYWAKTLRNYEPARTRFFDRQIEPVAASRRPQSAPSTVLPTSYVYIDLGFFDAEVAARRRGRPAGRGLRPRARVRPSRPEPHRRAAQRQPRHRGRRAARCASSSRPTATPGSGSAVPWTPASSRTSRGRTSTRRSTPRGRGRRRPHPGARGGPGDARVVDARLLRPAPDVVRPRYRGSGPTAATPSRARSRGSQRRNESPTSVGTTIHTPTVSVMPTIANFASGRVAGCRSCRPTSTAPSAARAPTGVSASWPWPCRGAGTTR